VYESAAWGDYCQKHSIIHEFSAPYSSAQNGLAERAIRTTMDDVRTLLNNSGLGHSYWAEAAAFSVDTRNLLPSRRHPGCIPLEVFSGKRQDVSHLCVFRAKCWAKIPTVHGAKVTGGSKLDNRGVECRFLGYEGGSGNYKVQEIASRCVFVSCDVIFEEGQPHCTSLSVGENVNIPLFDTLSLSYGNDNINTTRSISQDINNNTSDHDNPDPEDQDRNHGDHMDIPTATEPTTKPRRSTCNSQPSNAKLHSTEYQLREVASRSEGQDWATTRP